MQTIKDFGKELGLNEAQTKMLEVYMTGVVMELVESIKEDNIKNFDETINSLKS
ncbi:MAG: hypothetical protein NTY75_01025 [Candidatus Shapirobacteria bacterium]|nr:hypothetical protein [Candidatus Shapirobacteria bacterium]